MEEKKKNEKKYLMQGEKKDPDGYLDSFPPGYRFCPTDEELIMYYLKPKNLNQPIPISCIKTDNVYNLSPQELTGSYKSHRDVGWYFFTKLSPSFLGETRQSHKAGNGQWKHDRTEKNIYSDGQVDVYKSRFFYAEGTHKIKTDWRMQEYKVRKASDPSSCSTANVKKYDYILYKIYKENRSEKNNLHQVDGIMATRIPDWYLDSLPPGYGFFPTDEELIVHYVKPKMLNQFLPINRIPVVNLYRHHPRSLTVKNKPLRENEWYFWEKEWYLLIKTKKDPINSNGRRIGYWKTGKEVPINSNGRRIGSKKSLTFYEGSPRQSTATNWTMDEYKLDQESAPTSMGQQEMELREWVLCNIHFSQVKEVEKKRK